MNRAAALAWLLPLGLLPGAGCGQRIEAALELCDPARSGADFVLPVRLRFAEGESADRAYRLEIFPKLLIVGQERVEIGVRLVRGRSHVVFDEMTDSLRLRSRDGARVVEPVPDSLRVRDGALVATIESVDE